MSELFRRGTGLLGGIVLLGLLGCDSSTPTTSTAVHGTVTFQGQPFMQGVIVFVPDVEKGNSGERLTAMIGHDGRYTLTPEGTHAIEAGWYRIALADPPNLFTSELGYPPFPQALRRPDASGLSREVQAGIENVMNFDIEATW